MLRSVDDLSQAFPHVPEDVKFTAAEFDAYRKGYDYALVMTVKTLRAAVERFELRQRTKRLEAKRRRGK